MKKKGRFNRQANRKKTRAEANPSAFVLFVYRNGASRMPIPRRLVRSRSSHMYFNLLPPARRRPRERVHLKSTKNAAILARPRSIAGRIASNNAATSRLRASKSAMLSGVGSKIGCFKFSISVSCIFVFAEKILFA